MQKSKAKRIATAAVSFVMAASMVGAVEAKVGFKTATASAYTAVANDGTIGIGESNEATDVTITNTEPATLSLSHVDAGRYAVYLYVTQATGNDQYIISAKLNDGTAVDLVMDQNLYKEGAEYVVYYAYVGAINVTEQSTELTLSTRLIYEDAEIKDINLTVDAYLTPFTIDDSNHLGGIPVTSENSAILGLSDVAAGKYVLTASALSITTEQYSQFPLSVEFGGNEISVPYTQVAGAFTAILDVTDETQLTLSTDSADSCVLDVRLVPYSISPDALRLAGVRVSSTAPAVIPLEEMNQSNYIVTVELEDSYVDTPVVLYAQFDGGAAKQLSIDDNYIVGYSANFETPTGAHELTITTESGEELIVAVSVEESTIEGGFPENGADFNLYQTHSYSYTATFSGYHVLSVNSDDAAATFDITLTTSPNSFNYVEIHGDKFPVYLEEGQTYYYHITYTGIAGSGVGSAVHATFAVSEWVKADISADTYYYVPVTPVPQEEGQEEIEPVVLSFAEGLSGAYNFSLFDIPMFMRLQGESVTLHYNGELFVLNESNAYSYEITIDGASDFYLTTSYGERVTLGLILTEAHPAVPDTLDLFTENTVTVGANQTVEYFVENLGAGSYTITLPNTAPSHITIESSTSEEAIITEGQTQGTFTLVLTGDTATTTVSLFITNTSDTEDVTVGVTIAPLNIVDRDTPQNMSLLVNHAYSYYVNLNAGLYNLTLTDKEAGANVRVYVDGVEIYPDNQNVALFYVSESGYVNVSYIYYDQSAPAESQDTTDVTSEITAATEATELALYEDNQITVSATENVKNYYLTAEEGTYYTYLYDLPEGVEIQVVVDGHIVIGYGEDAGEFEVPAATTVIVTVFYNGTADDVSFVLYLEY